MKRNPDAPVPVKATLFSLLLSGIVWPWPTLCLAAEIVDSGLSLPSAPMLSELSARALWNQLGWWWLPIILLLFLTSWLVWRLGRKKGSFQQTALRWNLLFVLGIVVLLLGLNTYIYSQEYQRNSQQVQQRLLEHSKKLLKQRVDFIIDFIAEEKLYQEQHLRAELKFHVDKAYNTAESLIANSAESMTKAELTRLVMETLRPIRFRNGRGYMFAMRDNGMALLYADRPEIEGRNLLEIRDDDNMHFVQETIRQTKERGGGYVTYKISKPGSETWDHLKLSYVRYLEHLDCFIGTGEYLDDFEIESRKVISERLEALQSSGNLTIFGVKYDGIELFGPGQGRNMIEATDRNGVKVVQELIAAARRGGGFVRYHMPASVDKQQYPKLSYSKPIPGWDSYIGAGVNLDHLEAELLRSQQQLQKLFFKQIVETALLIPFIAIVLLLVGRWLSTRINRNVRILETSLEQAATRDIFVDPQKIEFDEFVHIADSANRMLQERQAATRDVAAREQNLSVTLDSIGDAVVVTDAEGRVTRMNPVAEQLTGWKSAEAVGKPLQEVFNIINAKTRAMVENPVQKVLETGQVVGLASHTLLLSRSGCEYQIADSAAPIRSGEEAIQGVVLVFRDVTEEYALSQALHESEERFRAMFDNAPLMVALLDPQGRAIFVNEQMMLMTGYRQEVLLSQSLDNIVSSGQKDVYSDCLRRVVSGNERVCRLDSSFSVQDGGLVEVDQSLAAIYGQDGAVRYVLLMAKDITERRHHEKHLEWLGMHDGLTGLANRTKLMAVVDAFLEESESGKDYWLLLNDLDRFKYINDNYGHAIGDVFLTEEGRRIQQICPENGLAARLSGDEFVIVAPFDDAEAVTRFAEELRRKICEPVECNGLRLQVETSTGIAAVVGVSASEVLRRADLAMYQVKRSDVAGGIQIYNEQMSEAIKDQQRLEDDIKQAIASEDQFQLYYQPIWDRQHRALRGLEALIRWDHPTRGRVMPNDFIPRAEESELIVSLGKKVLDMACRDISCWQKQHPLVRDGNFRVSINLSSQHLMTVDLVDDVKRALSEYAVEARSLCLEITETAIMEDPGMAAKRINALKEIGLHLAIDDFGTGYSSLSYLNQFNVDIIKVDRSMTSKIDVAGTSFKVCGAIIQLAHDLDLRVVAEGVETPAHLEVLDRLGCDFLQGYLTGRPMPADDVQTLLEDGRCDALHGE